MGIMHLWHGVRALCEQAMSCGQKETREGLAVAGPWLRQTDRGVGGRERVPDPQFNNLSRDPSRWY